jgi:hypothetical protein
MFILLLYIYIRHLKISNINIIYKYLIYIYIYLLIYFNMLYIYIYHIYIIFIYITFINISYIQNGQQSFGQLFGQSKASLFNGFLRGSRSHEESCSLQICFLQVPHGATLCWIFWDFKVFSDRSGWLETKDEPPATIINYPI